MKVFKKSHVFDTLPPYRNNRTLPHEQRSEQIRIGLSVATLPEQDAYRNALYAIDNDYAVDKAKELRRDKSIEFVGSKVAYIEGLEIEGIEGLLTFKDLYNEGPPEIANWVMNAIMTTTELSAAERKNFVPESDSH
jgi:hypothetical protein